MVKKLCKMLGKFLKYCIKLNEDGKVAKDEKIEINATNMAEWLRDPFEEVESDE